MDESSFIWMNGKWVPWADATVHVLTHTLHYASGAFEGIRFYPTPKGPAIYRLQSHVERLFYSTDALGFIMPFTKEIVTDAIIETVEKNQLQRGYIRPLVYSGYGTLKIAAKENPVEVMIACWQLDEYLPSAGINLKVSKYIRVHPDSTVADAKLVGHYLNGVLATQEIANTHYQEVLFLDYEGYIAEGAGDNIFLIKDGTLYTPKSGNILAGITRDTILDLARRLDMSVEQKKLTLDDAYQADEIFLTGTAVEVSAVRSLDDKLIGDGEPGPFYQQFRRAYMAIVHGEDPEYSSALTWIKPVV